MILVDTCVVSEFMRSEINDKVAQWAASRGHSELVISAITVQEIEYGVRLLPDGRRREGLELAWREVVRMFEDSVIAYDAGVATAAADALVRATRAGRPMSLADAQIAGTCLARGWVLATRNVSDFEILADLDLINPFA